MKKNTPKELALFGGKKMFEKPISTSNLYKPNLDDFLVLMQDALDISGRGKLVKTLEMELAAFHSVPHCITVCSGFWALVLSIKALALEGRNEVIMPSLTYRRLADVVAWAGLTPHFCEVDKGTLAISPATAKPHINANTALIIGVHPIINCCDARGLEELAKSEGIPILFDGVESVFETIGGQKVGSFGQAECFSFHASKLINGFEGGYITTHSDLLAERLRKLAWCEEEINSLFDGAIDIPLPAIHAAMALQGLREIDLQVQHNLSIYRHYQKRVKGQKYLELLDFDESEQTSFKNIVIKLGDDWPLSRDRTIKILNSEGILCRAYYSPPLHLRVTSYKTIRVALPFTEFASEIYLLMPCGYQVGINEVDEVMDFMDWIQVNAVEINKYFAGLS